MAAAVEPQRLEKKVAQLTKVVVFLNKKNEENHRERGLLCQKHEDEIQTILQHARTRIERVAMRVGDVGSADAVLDALTARIRAAAQQRADAEIARARENERACEERYAAALKARTEELDSVRAKAIDIQKRANTALQAADSTAREHDAALRENADRLERERAVFEAKVVALENECATLRAAMDSAAAEHAAEAERARKELDAACAAASNLKATVQASAEKLAASESVLATTSARANTLEEEVRAAAERTATLEADNTRLQESVDEAEAARLSAEAEHHALAILHKDELHTRDREIDRLTQELAEARQAHEKCAPAIARLEAKLDAARAEAKRAAKETEMQLAALRAELDSASTRAQKEKEALQSDAARRSATAAERRAAEMQERHDAQLRELRATWDKDRSTMVKQHKEELSTAVANAVAKATSSLSSSDAVDLQLAREDVSRLEHEARIAAAKITELTEALKHAKQSTADAEARAESATLALAERDAEVQRMQQELEGSGNAVSEELRKAREAASAAAAEAEHHRNDARTSRSALTTAEQRVADATRAAAEELAMVEKRHSEHIAAMSKQMTDSHNAQLAALQVTVEDLRGQLELSIARLDEVHAEAASAQAKALGDLREQLTREAKLSEDRRVDEVRRELEAAAEAGTGHADKLARECAARDEEIASMHKALRDARDEHETSLSNARADAEVRLETALAEAEERAARNAADAEAAHAAKIQEVIDAGEKAVNEARAAARADLAARECAWKEELSAAIANARQAVRVEIELETARQLAEASNRHSAAVKQMQAELDAARQDAIAASVARDDFARRVSELESKAAEHATRERALVSQVEAKDAKLQEEYRKSALRVEQAADESAKMADAHQATICELKSRHEAEVDELRAEIEAIQATANAKLAVFEEEFRAAEAEFARRPSLPEDLARIADLEERLTAELKKSSDLARLNKKYALEVRHQDRTVHTLLKGDAPSLTRTTPLPVVGGKATARRHAPRGSGLPK